MNLFRKMRATTQSPPMVTMIEVVWSWVGAFIGIGLVGLVGSLVLDQLGQGMLIGSFGATAVLVYGAIRSPLAQPRNFLGGHVVSALTGVLAYHLVGGTVWLATAIAVMYLTKTLPPPPPPGAGPPPARGAGPRAGRPP
jgi:CBS-domain-containing membrane protein